MKPPFQLNTTRSPASANSPTEGKGLEMSAIWNVWLSCVELFSETVSEDLLAEVRDVCSVRGMISHNIQGPIRFQEGLRRHAGWIHVIDGSRAHFSRHKIPTETCRSLDLVDARFCRPQVLPESEDP